MTKWIDMNGSQLQRLNQTVVRLFNTNSLGRLLLYRLDVDINASVAPGAMEDVVFEVVRKAQQEGWLDDFLLAVSESRPNQPVFEALKTELGLAKSVAGPEAAALEAFVAGIGGLVDPQVLRTKLAAAEAAVCQISYIRPDGAPYGGTGCLVGPSVVITNHHVMRYVIDGSVPSAAVTVLFDFKLDGDGNTVNAGNRSRLADSWLIDSSPHSATDLQSLPTVVDTPLDELDYALVRLDTAMGCLAIATNVPGKGNAGVSAGDPRRGWIKVGRPPATVAPNSPLLILQHPNIGMMKLAWDPDGVLAVNQSGTRLRHATATLPGSSGSPCFDASFNLVAIHHAGDPAETNTIPAKYNEAIPMTAIVNLLVLRSRAGVLDEHCAQE